MIENSLNRKRARLLGAALFLLPLCALVPGGPAASATRVGAFLNARVETGDLEGGLAATIDRLRGRTGSPQWVAWTVPAADSRQSMCCYDDYRGDPSPATCNLESGNRYQGRRDDAFTPGGDLRVVLRLAGGALDRVEAFSTGCLLDAGGLAVTLLDAVPPETSVRLLEAAATGDGTKRLAESAVMAIAGHGSPAADDALGRFAHRDSPRTLRERAAFWSGASRGAAGLVLLRDMLRQERDASVVEQVVFGISLSQADGAGELLLKTARKDERADVRKKAIFWLSQRAGERAVEALGQAVDDDPDAEVREQAVFALSQLSDGRGIPLLIDLARHNRHPEVRRRAIFWLGQSGDTRALSLFEEILEK